MKYPSTLRLISLILLLAGCANSEGSIPTDSEQIYEWAIYDNQGPSYATLAEMGGKHVFHDLAYPVECKEGLTQKELSAYLLDQVEEIQAVYQAHDSIFFVWGDPKCRNGGITRRFGNAAYIAVDQEKDELGVIGHEIEHMQGMYHE